MGAEPVLPAWVLRRRMLVAGNLAAVGVGRQCPRCGVLRGDRQCRARLGTGLGPGTSADSHHVFIGAAVVAVMMGLAAAMMPHTAREHDAVTVFAPDAAEA